MTWQQILRKDLEDIVRSRMLWSILAVFIILMSIVTLGVDPDSLGAGELEATINIFMTIAGELLLPATALLIGYMAIVGERQSGSLRVLFGLSHSRSDVFIGKLTSRILIASLVAVVACLTTAVLILARFGSLPAGTFLEFVLLTVLMAAVFAAIAIGISAVASTRMQSMGGVVGVYVVFGLLWHPIVAGIHYVLEGELAGFDAPAWYFLLQRLSPLTAYRNTVGSVTDQYLWSLFGWPNVVEDIAEENMLGDALMVSNRIDGDLPFYLSDWFAVLILVAWIVVPVTIGYWQFQNADLN